MLAWVCYPLVATGGGRAAAAEFCRARRRTRRSFAKRHPCADRHTSAASRARRGAVAECRRSSRGHAICNGDQLTDSHAHPDAVAHADINTSQGHSRDRPAEAVNPASRGHA